jgi:geranylgeranyl reductase family protein
MSVKKVDVLIIGAGPAGASTALFLAKQNISSILVDKDSFPRDKVCGDALSGKVVEVLKKYNPAIVDDLALFNKALPSYGVSFYAPNGNCLRVPFKPDFKSLKIAPGFVCKRIDFDNFLIEEVKKHKEVTFIENSFVKKFEWSDTKKQCFINEDIYEANIVVACDGPNSLFQKKVLNDTFSLDLADNCYGLRAYYKNVKGLDEDNFIELHFVDVALPGYFWIFPMSDNTANVGLGLKADVIKEKKIHLPELLNKILALPQFKDRFSEATLEGNVKLHALPMGNKQRKLSGDNFLLCGDAGALIDPFTGEGIGNAMLSGMIAAEVIKEAREKNDFSAQVLKYYDEKIYKRLGPELQISTRLQSLVKYQSLFNFVVNKANKNKTLRDTISSMFVDVDLRSKFKNPLFYLKLIFN